MIETVVLCGRTCAGKTVGGSFLSIRYELRHIEASSIMRECWSVAADGSSLDEFALRMLLEAPHCVPIGALERSLGMPVVITGLRSPRELSEVKRLRPDVRVIFVEAGSSTRLRRSLVRARPGHPKTAAELDLIDQIHEKMGIGQIATDPGVVMIRNEWSIERYHTALEIALST